ncbi:MAG: Asp-tRNA(Asn)/Glu-tRNA(Gln) amidotransferase subunit GatA [Clostridiales bacterium]|nr:Asp-tRNA(Asn)/Glu-tRNA(Gln) amidotransferase subunit GatA [Clostridiales bacterium]
MDYAKMTALELASKIRNNEISAVEVTKAQIKYIKEQEDRLSCFITLLEDEGLKRAYEVQERIAKGDYKDSPLAGVPMAVKDNILTKNIRTTCASRMLETYIPSYNARVIDKLEDAGAIILGKLNMDEFAMGNSSESSYFGPTRNPFNTDHVPGGSSGGSAAAVAAGEVFYSLGSDTGGSIRQPSSYCGVTGIKPTYGTVSRNGLIGFASSFDQIGPIAKNVSDATAVLDIIKGYDSKDSTSIAREYDSYTSALTDDVRGMKIGVPKEFLDSPMNSQIREQFDKVIKVYRDKGATVEYVDFQTSDYIIPTYYILTSAEVSANLSRFDGIRYGYRSPDAKNLEEIYFKSRAEGFGDEAKLRILLGSYVLSSDNYDTYYDKALRIRRLISNEFDDFFSNYDILLGPTSLFTAFNFNAFLNSPVEKYADSDNKYTIIANLIGSPAMSIPCGYDEKGLPIGMQLIGRKFGEKDIIRSAYSLEKEITS